MITQTETMRCDLNYQWEKLQLSCDLQNFLPGKSLLFLIYIYTHTYTGKCT